MQRQKASNATEMRRQRQEDLQRREEERQRELEVLRGRTLVARRLMRSSTLPRHCRTRSNSRNSASWTALREAALHATREKTRQHKAEHSGRPRGTREGPQGEAVSDEAKRAQATRCALRRHDSRRSEKERACQAESGQSDPKTRRRGARARETAKAGAARRPNRAGASCAEELRRRAREGEVTDPRAQHAAREGELPAPLR